MPVMRDCYIEVRRTSRTAATATVFYSYENTGGRGSMDLSGNYLEVDNEQLRYDAAAALGFTLGADGEPDPVLVYRYLD